MCGGRFIKRSVITTKPPTSSTILPPLQCGPRQKFAASAPMNFRNRGGESNELEAKFLEAETAESWPLTAFGSAWSEQDQGVI
jgi:hypothetical protein